MQTPQQGKQMSVVWLRVQVDRVSFPVSDLQILVHLALCLFLQRQFVPVSRDV